MEVEEKREQEGCPEGRGPGGALALPGPPGDAIPTVAAGLAVLGYSRSPPATEQQLSHQPPNLYRVVIIALLERSFF